MPSRPLRVKLAPEFLEDRSNPVTITFGQTASYDAGNNGIGVAAGDINNDGYDDVAFATAVGGYVFLNDGTGVMHAASGFAVSDPRTVLLADVNNDGNLDILVATGQGMQITTQLGNGDGTFQAAVGQGVGASAQSAAVADFNGDGKLDVAVTAGGLVAVLLNNGSPTIFGTPTMYNDTTGGIGISTGDFNNDGHPDIVLGGYYTDREYVLLNNGNGTFGAAAQYLLGWHPGSVFTGDLNNDGYDDIVSHYGGSNAIAVLLANPNGTFQPRTELPVAIGGPGSVALADMDLDGNLDIVAAVPSANRALVYLGNGDGTFENPTQAPTGFFPTSIAVADFNGDNAPDLVASNGTSPASFLTAINTTPIPVASFVVSAPANAVAGQAFTVTVTAKSEGGVTLADYTGTVHFTSTDGLTILPADVTFLPGDHGVKTISVTLATAGSQTVTATDTSNAATGASDPISVAAAAATHFAVSAPTTATAGNALNFTVTARDQFGNIDTNYSGTVHFTSTDDAALLPADVTLTNGVGTFSATLKTVGSQSITATATSDGSVTGTSGSITVNAAVATHFVVSAPASATAGGAFNFTVTAQDDFGNTATSYSGTIHFTSTDDAALLPADVTLTNGVGTFSATLKTVGSQNITATDTVDGSIADTSDAIAVSAGSATHFAISAPASATAGDAFSFTVTALDDFGNVDTNYSGTVHFTSTDSAAILPADATLTNGTGTFGATLKTSGSQSISATDTVTGSVTGTSDPISVAALSATHFAVSAPSSATAGSAFNFTVTALDDFGNTAINYSGTIHFTSTDSAAVLPADVTLTNGTGTFSTTLKAAGNRTITATDTVTSSVKGTSNSIAVSAAVATHFAISAPNQATAGVALSFAVTALDQFGNTATGYTGTIHFTSSDGTAMLPADATLANGIGTFSVTLKAAGNQTVTATDTTVGTITGVSGSITVAQPITVTPTTLPSPVEDKPYSATVAATGGSGGFTFTVSAGALPDGLTLNASTGAITGTPTTAGLYSFTITATDGTNATGSQLYSGSVGSPEPPSLAGTGAGLLVTGAGAGALPHVMVRGAAGELLGSFYAFDLGFVGGVSVAFGDVNGDGVTDVVVGAGPGAGPHVKVIDGTKLSLVNPDGTISEDALLASFYAFDPAFTGGVSVTVGRFGGDTEMSVAVGAGPGAGPHVRTFTIVNRVGEQIGGPLGSFYVFDPAFHGGVTLGVAASSAVEDNLVVGVLGRFGTPGASSHVAIFNGTSGSLVSSFYVFDPRFVDGVSAAFGDVNGDGVADVVVGAGPGAGPHVKVIDGTKLSLVNPDGTISEDALLASFYAFDPAFRGGVSVAVGRFGGTGMNVVVGAGSGAGPHVRTFSITGGLATQIDGPFDSFYAFDPLFTGGDVISGG